MSNNTEQYDVLILGAGIAGLSLALYLSEKSKKYNIAVLAKSSLEICNTVMAKGGVAAVSNFEKDSFDQHIEDTYLAGLKKGDREIIEKVVYEAPDRIKDLIKWGVNFDCKDGIYDLHLEGGHSQKRILHQADYTGKEIHNKLLLEASEKDNIHLISKTMGLDFYSENERVKALMYLDEEDTIRVVYAKVFVLATGGGGQLFKHTTNSEIATADGVAMAARIGADIEDMQYFQFHPTAIYKEDGHQLELLTEALRGYGAQLVNKLGERFMYSYDEMGDLANRAVVSTAIFQEMRKYNTQYVYLSLSHLDQLDLKEKFPAAYNSCISAGYNPERDLIPIVPAAHYQCGGVLVNQYSETSIANLYAIGECACTKLHGANRLASNSLIEALVFAYSATISIDKQLSLPYEKCKQTSKDIISTLLVDSGSEIAINIVGNLQFIQNIMSDIHHEIYSLDSLKEVEQKLLAIKNKINKAVYYKTKKTVEFLNILEVSLLYTQLKIKESVKYDIKEEL